MTKEKENPIAARSKTWIIHALLDLMEEKPYADITISEIAKRADLVRRTFYRNFSSKEAILEAHFKGLIADYLSELPEEGEVSPYTLALNYFRFWQQHITFIRALQRNNLFHVLLSQIDDFVPGLNLKYKKSIIAGFSDTYFEYYTVFIAAGLWHMLEKWVAKGMVETPEAMAQIYSDLITPTRSESQ